MSDRFWIARTGERIYFWPGNVKEPSEQYMLVRPITKSEWDALAQVVPYPEDWEDPWVIQVAGAFGPARHLAESTDAHQPLVNRTFHNPSIIDWMIKDFPNPSKEAK